ncbi:reverse transcriptase protein [Rutstroemia sp. NJR-2017a WRK4]|nr:reverse transcriptase protein [Rutstroemia sp. NJR-2017a WRK4]
MASTLPRTDWDQVKKPPDPAVLKLHRQLKKAESTSRTSQQKQCECGQGWETPKHVLLYCSFEDGRRVSLGENQDFVRLLDTPQGVLVASKWMIQSGRLQQFQVANSLLYESPN